MILPRNVGSFTLMRKLDADGVTDCFVGIVDDPPGKQVLARRPHGSVSADPARRADLATRVADLRAVQHPSLARVLDLVEADGEPFVFEEWVEGVSLGAIIRACRTQGVSVPADVLLHLATQICTALETLHAQPGAASQAESLLHGSLQPDAIFVSSDGRVMVGRYGLTPSSVLLSAATGGAVAGVEYLAPEQTHQDIKLTPAADLFALGTVLYELLTLRTLFRDNTSLQTILKIRRFEVTTQLLEVKELMPGLDKVLFRALSPNARHRYQRAFVLREELRGLMAGYTFSDIEAKVRTFLAPLARAESRGGRDGARAWSDVLPDEGRRLDTAEARPAPDAAALLAGLSGRPRPTPRPAEPRGVDNGGSFPPPKGDDLALVLEPDDTTSTTHSLPFVVGPGAVAAARAALDSAPPRRPTVEVELYPTEIEPDPPGAGLFRGSVHPTYALAAAMALAAVVLVTCAGAGGIVAWWLKG